MGEFLVKGLVQVEGDDQNASFLVQGADGITNGFVVTEGHSSLLKRIAMLRGYFVRINEEADVLEGDEGIAKGRGTVRDIGALEVQQPRRFIGSTEKVGIDLLLPHLLAHLLDLVGDPDACKINWYGIDLSLWSCRSILPDLIEKGAVGCDFDSVPFQGFGPGFDIENRNFLAHHGDGLSFVQFAGEPLLQLRNAGLVHPEKFDAGLLQGHLCNQEVAGVSPQTGLVRGHYDGSVRTVKPRDPFAPHPALCRVFIGVGIGVREDGRCHIVPFHPMPECGNAFANGLLGVFVLVEHGFLYE